MIAATLLAQAGPWAAAAQDVPAPLLSVARPTLSSPGIAGLERVGLGVGTEPTNKLAASITAAGNDGLLRHGTNIAKRALLDCQSGDYPGGGIGTLSLPDGRAESRTAHCRR